MKKTSIDVDGKFCQFRPLTYKKPYYKKLHSITDICPLCEETIVEGDMIFLVINNSVLFPNKLIHVKCADKDLENTAKKLRLEYKQAKKYEHWFI